jgi:cysteine-rich repeat protein
MDTDLDLCGCIAQYGYNADTGMCKLCGPGFEKWETGAKPCIEVCAVDSERNASTGNCTVCSVGFNTPEIGPHVCKCDAARNHWWDEALELCGCIAGYGYNDVTGVCTLCATNFEKLESGTDTCTLSPNTRKIFKMAGECFYIYNAIEVEIVYAAPCYYVTKDHSQVVVLWPDDGLGNEKPLGIGIPIGEYEVTLNKDVGTTQPSFSTFTWSFSKNRRTIESIYHGGINIPIENGRIQSGDEITICSKGLDCNPCWGAYQEWDSKADSCGCIADYEYDADEKTCGLCADGEFKPFSGAESCRKGNATRLTFIMRGECNRDPEFLPCLDPDTSKLMLDRTLSGKFVAVVRKDWMSNPEKNNIYFDWDAGSGGNNWIHLPPDNSFSYKKGDSVSVCSDSGTFPTDQDCSPCYNANMDWDVISGSCACLAGYERVYDENKIQWNCNPCPFHFSKAVHGPESCMEGCIAGYEYDTSIGSCTQCPFGFSKHYPGTDPCFEGCVPGYEYDNQTSSCTPCPTGLSKNFAGTEPCIEGCEANFELNQLTGSCTECEVGFNTPEVGAHFCKCDASRNHVMDHDLNLCGCVAGYEYNTMTGVCSLCATDFEKLKPGAHACTLCPIGTHTPEYGEHACSCDADRNHVWDNELQMCGCIAGFGFSEDTGFCRKCMNPYFKAESGAHSCTKCTVFPTETSESATYCEEQFDRTTFLVESECIQKIDQDYPCINNWPGRDVDYQSLWLKIGFGLKRLMDYHVMIRRMPFSDDPLVYHTSTIVTYVRSIRIPFGDADTDRATSTDRGLVHSGDEITFCQDNPQKNTFCETECYAAHSRWDKWTFRCGCDPGYHNQPFPGEETDICMPCPQGFSKSASGSEQCIEGCIADFEYDTTDSVCKACRLGFTKDFSGPGSCKCEGVHAFDTNFGLCGCIANYGYDADTGYCKTCPVGFSKVNDGAHACTCDGGNHIFDSVLNTCGCIAGFEYDKDTGVCEACPAGFSKVDSGQQSCTACATGFYTSQSGSSSCQSCEETTEYESSISCKCLPGHVSILEEPLKCEKCDNTSIAVNATVCVQCIDIDQNSQANSNRTACICQSEFFLYNSPTSSQCKLCHEGTIKPESGNHVCEPCNPTTSNILSVSNGRMICGCIQGFQTIRSSDLNGTVNTTCGMCAHGTYNDEPSLERCKTCPAHTTGLAGAKDLSYCNICLSGYFMNTVFECEMCPRNSENPNIGSVGLGSCKPCRYGEFQSEPGKAACVQKNVELFENPIDHVIGLFVDGDTSCVYITRDYSGKTDRICWGSLHHRNDSVKFKTKTVDDLIESITMFEATGSTGSNDTNVYSLYTAFQQDVLPLLPAICGDGMKYPFLEECDDGNAMDLDGCSADCKIENGFGCELPIHTKNPSELLSNPSLCCRLSQVPFLQTGKCSSCSGRLPPYMGVKYDPHNCELQDIDECNSVLTNNCFHSSKICVNFDAVSASRETYKCMCASPLPEDCTDLQIDHGAYTVRGVVAVATTNVSATMEHMAHQTQKLISNIHLTNTQTTTIVELSQTNTNGLYPESNAYKSYFELTFLCESWNDMQMLASQMNLTVLGELLLM